MSLIFAVSITDATPGLAVLVGSSEQRVFSVWNNRPDQILDLDGVDLDAPVGQEGLWEAVLLI